MKLLRLLFFLVLVLPVAAQTGPGNVRPPDNATRMLNAVTGNGSATQALNTRIFGAVKLTITISGTATVNFEGRIDISQSFGARRGVKESDTANTTITSTTTSGDYIVYLAGDEEFNPRVSGCSACTVTVWARPIPSIGKAIYQDGGGSGSSGTVTDLSIVSANGVSGSVANSTTTPAITLTVQNAAADGSTKGIASFNASDFDASSGNVSLDYLNGQSADATHKGFLPAADFVTFNTKQGAISFGTGVQTALGVNIGSAGAPVLNGGVLGSPSSVGTLPAFTLGGTVSGGGNQINNVIIGTTTPLAGFFTAVTNSGLTAGRITFAGASGLLSDSAAFTVASTALSTTNRTLLSITTAGNIGTLNTTNNGQVFRNLYNTNTPTSSMVNGGTFTFVGAEQAIDVTGLSVGNSTISVITPQVFPVNGVITGTMTFNDTNGNGGVGPVLAAVNGSATLATTITAAVDGIDGTLVGGNFSATLTHSQAGGILSAYGVKASAAGVLAAGHNHYGVYAQTSGAAGGNYGLYSAVSPEATNNYGLFIDSTLTSGANNYAINSASTAQSVLSGALTVPTFTDSGLTAGRVIFSGTGGLLSDDADMTFSADTLTVTKVVSTNMGVGLGATANPTTFTVGDTSSSTPRGIMSWQASSDTSSAHLHLRKSRGTFASPTIVVVNDLLGRVVYSGYDGSNYLEMASIRATAVGTVALTRIPTKLEFLTATDAAPSVATVALTLNKDQSAVFAGAVTATSINGNTFTTGTYTLTGTAAKTLNFTNTLTLSGTDSTTMTFPTTSATIARTDAANTFTGTQSFGVITQTSASATAFESGPNGGTNPVLRLVNNTASQADGVTITGGPSGNGTTFTAIGPGSTVGFTFTPKGNGGLTVQAGATTAGGLFLDGSANPAITLKSSGTIKGYAPVMVTSNAAFFSDSLAGDMAFRSEANRVLFGVGSGASTMQVSSTGVGVTSGLNIKLAGTATRGTTEGTNHLDIFNGTPPVGTLTNGASFYVSGGEMFTIDSGGTATQLSSHDKDGYLIYNTHYTATGRRVVIDAEKLLRFLNSYFGTDFVHEYLEVKQ